jgi:putative addiction module component (TIGR02574 family)
MKPNEIAKEIDKLGLAEKLILVEDIWDDIARNNGELPMPEWQKVELDKRYSDYLNGTLQLHDWEGVHQEIRNKSK